MIVAALGALDYEKTKGIDVTFLNRKLLVAIAALFILTGLTDYFAFIFDQIASIGKA